MHRQPWLAVELRHLAALSAVAREGSFRAAAERLGYTQSAVSEQIAVLESTIGMRVLERRRGSAPDALTDAGKLLLRRVDEVLCSLTLADVELEALRDGRHDRLRLGVFESAATRILPPILCELRQDLPDVEVELTWSDTNDDLAELVVRGELDAAFSVRPQPDGPLAACELLRDPHVLMVPAAWPLAHATGPLTASSVQGLPLIGPPSDERSLLAEAELRSCGVELEYVVGARSVTAVQALVGAGVGAAIVPRLAADASDRRVALLDLDALVSPRTIVLHWCKGRTSRALERFVELAARSVEEPPATPAPAPTVA
jgi:DNA-binding transcriptional LysR family regulator